MKPGTLAGFVHQGVALYNAGRFWEAHEALEQVWRASGGAARPLWQGLIQAAAAALHEERGNSHGVEVQGGSAVRKMRGKVPAGFPVEVERFAARLELWLDARGPGSRGGAPLLELVNDPERFFAQGE